MSKTKKRSATLTERVNIIERELRQHLWDTVEKQKHTETGGEKKNTWKVVALHLTDACDVTDGTGLRVTRFFGEAYKLRASLYADFLNSKE